MRKKYINSTGVFMGLLHGMLFGWIPLLVIMSIIGVKTLEKGPAALGLAISYAITIPALIALFSYSAWKDGWEKD